MVAGSRVRWCSKGAWPGWWSQILVTAQPKECASEGSDEDREAPEVFPAPRRIAAGGDQESVQKTLHSHPPQLRRSQQESAQTDYFRKFPADETLGRTDCSLFCLW